MLFLVARARQQPMIKMILNNCGITVREVADDVGILFGSCQAIFTTVLDMKRTATLHGHRSVDVDNVQ